MSEKKKVYNGYEERYLSGMELKKLFENHYYMTGRHHSVILGILIPDYLELNGISDSEKYRIFFNEHFCRVMRADTDSLIVFFGHGTLENTQMTVDTHSTQLVKICPICGSQMQFKIGKYGEFLGCSDYPNCKKTIKVPIIGHC